MDLVLFPEYVEKAEIENTSVESPSAVVAGAYREGSASIGVIFHQGKPVMEYQKVRCDGRTRGSGNVEQNTIYRTASSCFGMLVCMDSDETEIMRRTVALVKDSKKRNRIVLVPGDMGDQWFRQDSVLAAFADVIVVMCNQPRSGLSRCPSFVTDYSGRKVAIQSGIAPIYAEVP